MLVPFSYTVLTETFYSYRISGIRSVRQNGRRFGTKKRNQG